MRLKYQFVVRKVGAKIIAVAVGKDNERFNGMVKLNTSGEFIFNILNKSNASESQIAFAFSAQYGITEEQAKVVVVPFLDYLRQRELLVE